MATIDSVMSKIRNLISRANTKTGRSDEDLTTAVDALIGGYMQGGITPTGTKTITENGTHDVASYASALVNVPTPEQKTVVRAVTLASDITGEGTTVNLLSGDDFVKAHYADAGFSATLFLVDPVASTTNTVHFLHHCNKNIGSSNVTRYGVGLKSTSASAISICNITAPINGNGYNASLRAASDGGLKCYLAANFNLKAGTYQIVLTCIT